MKRRLWIALPVVMAMLLATLGVVGTALATHPSVGQTTEILTRRTLKDLVNFNLGDVRIHTKAPVDLVFARVTFVPGGSSGWHWHPGPVFVGVASGTLTVYREDCSHSTYFQGGPEGAAFFESATEASLLVRNEGTVPVVVYAQFIVPPTTPSTGLRIPAPDRCGLL
jgi:hypothetical protein